ncbi:VanW family protein [Caldanaerobacter sp.]|uniref:VanW family protein n=1 Tax=Caldanaerobacter sp. TaxID=2930036 RepID=UPI003C75D9E1
MKEEQIISKGIVDSPNDPKFVNNIKNAVKALEYLDGTTIKPNKIFSFNKTVGKRTLQRGFVKGLSGSGGYYYPDVGGGVCQTATAVYRAAVNAGFKIVERHKHLYGAIYAPKGDDAAIDWDANWDLKFKNTSPYTIIIRTYTTPENKAVVVEFVKQDELSSILPKNYKVKIFVNDSDITYNQDTGLPFILGERTYVPIRATAEQLGAEVKWDSVENSVEIKYNDKMVKFFIGQEYYLIDTQESTLDATPFISPSDGRIYMPLRYLAEGLGLEIKVELIDDVVQIRME